MAGIAIVLDLLRKNPGFSSKQSLHSPGFFTASSAASAAAFGVASGAPFATRFLFGYPKAPISYCDAGAAITDDYIANIRRASEKLFPQESIHYTTKEYRIELKPLFSAFEFRTLALTTLRSFLLYYLPLLDPKFETEENDEDFLQESPEERRVDLVVPFKKSIKQIIRETTVVTTRRILERLAVHYVSQRMAWKLLKDIPKSAVRKAERGLSTPVYIFRISRTTLRGHFLGVAASWIVQVGIEIYRCVSRVLKSKEENNQAVESEEARVFGKKVAGITIRCGASLVFASIGAGIGAAVIRPSAGQRFGCAIGDLAGPIVVSVCLEKVVHSDL